MDIVQTQPTSPAATTTGRPPADQSARSKLTSDYEMFLKMLTTQMTNQDPLNPVDSSDYAVQLATFSSVEQQVRTNELLTTLTNGLNPSGLSDLANWIDRTVRSKAPTYFSGSPVTIAPNADSSATRAELKVLDESGATVQTLAFDPGKELVEWAGVDSSGNPMPSGLYTFKVSSYQGEDLVSETQAESYSRVIEARVLPEGTKLVLEGGTLVNTSEVTAMRR